MKKKRKILILLSLAGFALFVATICIFVFPKGTGKSDTGKNASDTGIRYSDKMSGYAVDGGYYYLDDEFIKFYDYKSQKTVKVCNKPNCTHNAWSAGTPLEERCNAYLYPPGFVSFFAHGQHLYFFMSEPNAQKTILYQSDLERGNIKELLVLDAEFIGNIYLKNNMAIFATNISQMGKDESGMPQPTGITTSQLHVLNLDTMQIRDLNPPQDNYTGEIKMCGIDKDTLYYNYAYFESKYIGTNFDEAKHRSTLYSYDLITGEIQQALQNVWSNDFCKAYTLDGYIYFSKYADFETRGCDLFRCSLETEALEQIAENLFLTGFYAGKLFYETPYSRRTNGQDNAASPYR